MRSPLPLALAAALVLPATLPAQGATLGARVAPDGKPAVAAAAQASAVRAVRAPVLDGRGDDEVWRTAPAITDFKVYDPDEGRTPSEPTTAQVAYDQANLYVLVRAHDVHRDSIRGFLSRRDVRTPSDWLRVMVDSYHDKRTGYQFAVNPVGVKRDIYVFNDGDEDVSWDAVWHVETSVDSAGWTAEFAIPWSQLRYPDVAEHTIGLMITREVGRRNERQSWPLLGRNRTGFVSQWGEVTGIGGLPSSRRLEVMPYVVTKEYNLERGRAPGFAHRGNVAAGADVKWGLTSNLTVDATINPDFGQVEADPATYNLGTTELFFSERRPFFIEGMGIFRFDLNCNDGECTGLFYSRRVGQSPLLGGRYGDASTPAWSTILGAGKLTGRFRNGMSVGLLNATTQREVGRPLLRPVVDGAGDPVDADANGVADSVATGRHYVAQPATNFAVLRAQQEFRGGNSVLGVMATGVNRFLDDTTQAFLVRDAYAAGLDFRHRFARNTWQVGGYAAASRVAGAPDAIARVQANGVHAFDREDATHVEYDAGRTALAGTTAQLALQRTQGLVRLFSGYTRTGAGFEINDAGYLGRADIQSWSNWVGMRFLKPRAFYRMVGLNFNNWWEYNTAGERLSLGGNVNGHSQLKNNWFVYGGISTNAHASYNDRDARGGPAFRRSPGLSNWAGIESDARKPVQLWVSVDHTRGDYGRSRYLGVGPGVGVRPSTRLTLTMNPRFTRNIDDSQWYGNLEDSTGVHYAFAHLDQRTFSLTSRLDFAATPTLSVQLYAAPFSTSGRYTDVRALAGADARNRDYATRLRRWDGAPSDSAAGGFAYRQFNSNAVMRWEYRPGSALFLVWSQGRAVGGDFPGQYSLRDDMRGLFRAHPQNTFLVKGSYWFSL